MDFFDKIKGTVTDTSKIVAQKAKDKTEVIKLKHQISTEEEKIKEAYLAIGKRYFEENIGEVSDAYINDFTIINEAKARICELQEQIKTIKGVFSCPNCGAEVTSDSSFCSSCGAKIDPPVQKEEPIVDVDTESAESTKEASEAAESEEPSED